VFFAGFGWSSYSRVALDLLTLSRSYFPSQFSFFTILPYASIANRLSKNEGIIPKLSNISSIFSYLTQSFTALRKLIIVKFNKLKVWTKKWKSTLKNVWVILYLLIWWFSQVEVLCNALCRVEKASQQGYLKLRVSWIETCKFN